MTKLELWNYALALLPHDRTVESEDEDSTEALRCRQTWEAARLSVLASHDWGFLTEELQIAGAQCDRGWLYLRPPRCVRVLGLFDRHGRRVRADALRGGFVTREPCASVRFVRDEPNPSRLPPLVQEALACELASRLAPVITGNRPKTAELVAAAREKLAVAWQADAEETAWHGTEGDTFLRARA